MKYTKRIYKYIIVLIIGFIVGFIIGCCTTFTIVDRFTEVTQGHLQVKSFHKHRLDSLNEIINKNDRIDTIERPAQSP